MKKIALILLILLVACAKPVDTQPQLKPLVGEKPSGLSTTFDGHSIAYNLYLYKPGSPAVILLHMLDRNKDDWATTAQWMKEKGYSVIVPDLRGHGQSTGDWNEFTPEDFNKMTYDVAAVKSVLQAEGADVRRLAIIGASIGANVALKYAAEDDDVKTIVLLSPGIDYRGVNIENINYRKPTMIVASSEDEYSAQTSEYLASRNTRARLTMYDGAGHGTNMFVKTDLAPNILAWLSDHV